MLQRRALKLNEGTASRGMHHLQNKFAAVAQLDKKIIVVFAV
jgi:hypothetical protein